MRVRMLLWVLLLSSKAKLYASEECRLALWDTSKVLARILTENPIDFIITHNPELAHYRKVFETLKWRSDNTGGEFQAKGGIILNPTRGDWKFLNFVVRVFFKFNPHTHKLERIMFDAGTEWAAEDGIDPKLDYSYLDSNKLASAERPESNPKFQEIVGLLRDNATKNAGAFGSAIQRDFHTALVSKDSNHIKNEAMVVYYPQHLSVETLEENNFPIAEQLGYVESLLNRLAESDYRPHPRH